MRIKYKRIKTFFQLMLFMLPVGLFNIQGFSTIWYAMLMYSLICFVIKNWGKIGYKILGKIEDSWIIYAMFFYMLTQTIATFLNGGNFLRNVMSAIVVLFMCVYLKSTLQKESINGIRIFKNLLLLYLCMEFVLYAFFDMSLLGTVQCSYLYYIVWATLSLYLSIIDKSRNKEVLFLTSILVLILIIKPEIGDDGNPNYEWTFFIIALLFCCIGLFKKSLIKVSKFIKAKTIAIILIAMNLILVVFRIQRKMPILRFLIVDIMHKDISLSGRSDIWKFAEGIALRKPVWGYGTGLVGLKETGFWIDFLRIHGPHNQFLYIMLAGGIITLITYLIFIASVFIKIDSVKQYKYTFIFVLGLLGVYIELLVTYRTIANCMPVFALISIISCVCSKREVKV